MAKINDDDKLLETIKEILEKGQRSFSVREIRLELEKRGIKRSPQLITKYLKILEKQGDAEEIKNNGKKI